MNRMPRGGASLRAIAIVVGLSLGLAGVFRPSTQSEIDKAAREVNATCPQQIDANVRMDKLVPGPMRMTYYYTFTTKVALTGKALEDASVEIQARTKGLARTNSDMKMLIGKGVTLGFVFSDMQGKELINFDVPGEK